MTDDQHEVGRLLRLLASDAGKAALGGVPPAEPVDLAEQFQDVLALQQRTAVNAARFNQASPGQPAARTGALVFAWAAARLGLVGAVLGETLEAAAHLFDAGAASLNARQLDALEAVVAQGLESTRLGLHALSADLLAISTAVTAGPPWPKVPLPAAAVALADPPARHPAPMHPAAGEHEPRPGAARQRTRHLLMVAAPPTSPPGAPPTSATVLPFRRP
ncbi:hypothetical protein ABH931_005808 [Streptacidiphilus sp. MAP12-33]|uniref:hypothetical protein n=1 Tax=Streptacidiphilus sp. MAP12-33 TaxID=3156266 RepID=UPI00351532CC